MKEQFSFSATGEEAIRLSRFKRELDEFYKHKLYSFEIKELMNTVFEVYQAYTGASLALDEICTFLSNADIERGKSEELDSALDIVLNATGRRASSSKVHNWNINLEYLSEVLNIVSVIESKKFNPF